MLWYKTWRETRGRFLLGLVILIGTAMLIVTEYPNAARLLRNVPGMKVGGEVERQIIEAAALSRTYRGYIWSQLFAKNLPQVWCLFAALLGAGGPVSTRRSRGVVYILSLPISRRDLVVTRATLVAAELLAMALIPALSIPVLSLSVGESYAIGDALIHGVCLFAGGSVFFGLAFLLSSFFDDWRTVMVPVGVAIALSALEDFFPWYADHGLFRLLSAASYFGGGGLPWLGLGLAISATAAMVYGAAVNVVRRDF